MKIGKELEYLLSLEKRKDAKERILKVYNALLYKRGKSDGYFNCPSAYLKKVSGQYNKVISLFTKYKVIDYQSYNNDESDIFNTRRKKYYNTEKGICIRYKFLIDTEEGYDYDLNIDYSSLYDNEKWYQKTRYSLLQVGFRLEDISIKRDNFSRRLHTNITGMVTEYKSYKNLLCCGDYYTIDAKTSQPRLLWIKMNEIGLQDKNLNYIFENGIDFYEYIMEYIPSLKDRDDAKELFASWVNGNGYLQDDKVAIRDIFPVVNTFIRNYKTSSYKNICRLLQNTEANIFIDDILNNIPLEFCLSVHDSIIVRKEDVDKALEWCSERRSDIEFVKEVIKEKTHF